MSEEERKEEKQETKTSKLAKGDERQRFEVTSETVATKFSLKKIGLTIKLSGVFALVTFVAFVVFLSSYNGDIPESVGWVAVVVATVSSIITILTGVISFVLALLQSKQRSECIISIAFVIVGSIASYFLVPNLIMIKSINECIMCLKKLEKLGEEIKEYAKNNDGYLPVANKWCDLLMEHNKNLSRDNFSCPVSEKEGCSYAFNRNLDGHRLTDIPGLVVLLYDADEGWNLSGGAELLAKRHQRNGTNILFIDGTPLFISDGMLDYYKDPSYWEVEAAVKHLQETSHRNQ
jgi:hypothetical protein